MNSQLDAILWNPAAPRAVVDSFCEFAQARRLRAVCVTSARVAAAAVRLEESEVKLVALIGFPLGNMESDAKRYEAELAFDLGAQEIEIVLGLGQIKDGDGQRLHRELADVLAVAEERPVGVTIELARLLADERRLVAEVLADTRVQRLCTSTDFWPDAQVTVADLAPLRAEFGSSLAIKAVGGLRDRALAEALLAAGAATIGSPHISALVDN